ncbi:hypothetical protein DFH28DRAFT_1127883 [Melampsora americana]|nr:hypothetical protein DFH28DRAFT_1127883 [Melampsora americana]
MQSKNTPMPDATPIGTSVTSNSAIPAGPVDIAAIISDALKQQAAQFETIKPTSSARDPNLSTPVGRKGPRASSTMSTPSSAKSLKTPKSSIKKTAKVPTPPRRLHPLQISSDATPAGFKNCRDALYVHIKMMWGLHKTTDIPTKPDATLLRDFYQRFSSTQEVEGVVEDPCSPKLIALETIISMKELRAGGGKIARGLGHIDQGSIFYMHGVLAKVGIRAWGPDLDDAPDSLYNSCTTRPAKSHASKRFANFWPPALTII